MNTANHTDSVYNVQETNTAGDLMTEWMRTGRGMSTRAAWNLAQEVMAGKVWNDGAHPLTYVAVYRGCTRVFFKSLK